MNERTHRARLPLRLWITGAFALALAGCQAEEAPPVEDQAATASGQTSPARPGPDQADQRLRIGEIVSVTATVTGARDTTYEGSTATGNVQPSGGCRDGRMGMGFTFAPADGSADGSSESWFRWEVGTPMEPGATGTFAVASVSFWYPRLGLPSRNWYEGEGSLEITRHDARRGAARITGRLLAQGLVENDGSVVDVDVSFDMGGSCGTIE